MITITERAAGKIKMNIVKRGRGIGIKVGVRTTGCSGLAYVLEYVDDVSSVKDYNLYNDYDANVWIQPKDLAYIEDMTIDYVTKGLNEGFEFINPKEKARCGCGESFTI